MNPPDLSVSQARIDANWQAITVELDAPRPGRIERPLARVGVPSWTARLLVATPALRRAWFVAMAVVIVVGLGAADGADSRNGLFAWLVQAPLLPVLGVAMAYGPESDPAHEITLATPLRGLRLVLTRSAAVIGLSVLALGLVSLLTPERSLMAAGWLVPSLACTSVALAAMTFVAPRRAAAVTAVGWLLVVLVARQAADDPLAAFTAVGQATAAAICMVGLIVRVADLSGGMVRRVGLAQSLLGDPSLLVLDEPSVALDPDERARLRGIVADRRMRSTVVVSTHLAEEAALADLVVVLVAGRLRFAGRPARSASGSVLQVTGRGGHPDTPSVDVSAVEPRWLSRSAPPIA